jgi:hypothetical protein
MEWGQKAEKYYISPEKKKQYAHRIERGDHPKSWEWSPLFSEVPSALTA